MLRITESSGDAKRVVMLEGKLLGAWVDEVRGLFVGTAVDSFPMLDLSRLSYVDRAGVEMLQELFRRGARIGACSPFVAELLRCECKPDRSQVSK